MKVAIFQLSLFGINCYVVFDETARKAAIIDPGIIDDKESEAIDAFLQRNGLEATHIINTHLHIDHAIGNKRLAERYGIDVLAHPADEPLLKRIQQQADMFGLPMKAQPSAIDRPLKDGDEIRIGDGTLKVIHVPGHSQGSVALYDAADGFLISGDALFAGSIGRTDLPGGDMSQLLTSIRTRLLTLPGDTVVYPGHGEPTTIAQERESNPFLR